MRIVFFTDCMSIGPDYIDESMRYPGLIQKAFPECEIIVRGASGATTQDSVKVLNEIVDLNPDIVVYGYGINDALPRGLHRHQRAFIIKSMYKLKLNKSMRLFLRSYFLNPLEYILQRVVQPKHYFSRVEMRANILHCVETCAKNDAFVIVMSINPVLNYRFVNSDYYIEQYNETIKDLCSEKKIPYVDIFQNFKENYGKRVLANDNFHYGALGHEIAANEIIPLIKNYMNER